jgi:hypothetical protein
MIFARLFLRNELYQTRWQLVSVCCKAFVKGMSRGKAGTKCLRVTGDNPTALSSPIFN